MGEGNASTLLVPLLALVAFLAPGGAEATLADRLGAVGIGLAAIAALVLAGRYLLDPMFRLLARFGAREVMTAAALLVVLGAAAAGSVALGVGASVVTTVIASGVILSAAGEVLCFIPNAIGRALLYNEKIL